MQREGVLKELKIVRDFKVLNAFKALKEAAKKL